MGMKTADQEDAAPPAFPFPFSFSLLLRLDVGLLLLSAGRRISDVMVGSGDGCISSLSSQRSIISAEDHEVARSHGGAFASAMEAVVGLIKNEESFDCPALSFFGFDASAVVEVPVDGVR